MSSMALFTGDPEGRLEVLEAFLKCSLASPKKLREQWEAQLDRITASTFFIIDQSSDLGVERFVHRTMPRLLQQLSHSTEQVQNVLHGQIRGRVLWGATYKARFTEEYNPSIYVCGEVRHRFNNPENQLLRYLVEHIADCLKSIPPAIRQGMCVFPELSYEDLSLEAITTLRLEALETAIHRLQGSVHLREVEAPAEITEFHLLRAATSRLEEYHEAERLYRRYSAYVIERRWESLAAAAQRNLPLPARLDEPAKSWVTLAAALYRTQT